MEEKEIDTKQKIIIAGVLSLLFGVTVITIWYYRRNGDGAVPKEPDSDDLVDMSNGQNNLVSNYSVSRVNHYPVLAPQQPPRLAPQLPSLKLAFTLYSSNCICGKKLANNCAHFLSDALIRAGYQINDGFGIAKFERCTSGRSIRAKELLSWAKYMVGQNKGESRLSHNAEHGHKTTINSGFWFVYQERRDGQGHVCLHDENDKDGKAQYVSCGTGDYPDWPIQNHFRF